MPQMIAKTQFRYAGRSIAAGEEFSATTADARVLLAIGQATRAAETVVTQRRRYKRRDMRAEA